MSMEHTKEPFMRISKRNSISPLWAWGIRLIAILISLVVCGVIIYSIVELNPLAVYKVMFEGVFGTTRRMWAWIRDIMMLLCVAVGLAPAFKMRFWNIGAEGQVLVGGIAAAACMIYLGTANLSVTVLLLIMAIVSAIAGGLWGVIPAVAKATFNTNETLFTLMMNYVAIQLTSFFVALWEHPAGSNSVGIINPTTKAGWFPEIFGQAYTLNVIIVLVLVVFIFIYMKYSKHGYELSVVGESENTARYAAINVKKVIVRTVTLSGAICGLAGFLTVAGADHTISANTAGGRGFTAIIIAWLAKFNPFVMILISALIVFLDKGAVEIASQFRLSDYVSEMITGIILFFILGSEFFINYSIKFRHRTAKEVDAK